MKLLAFTYKGVAECAEACPEWWYREEQDKCVKQVWRRNVAVAVPVIVVVALIGGVLVVLLARRKRS